MISVLIMILNMVGMFFAGYIAGQNRMAGKILKELKSIQTPVTKCEHCGAAHSVDYCDKAPFKF